MAKGAAPGGRLEDVAVEVVVEVDGDGADCLGRVQREVDPLGEVLARIGDPDVGPGLGARDA